MATGLARIFVQNSFCNGCTASIRKKVMEVQDIKNIALYPSDSLVVFNFRRANQVSEVLNTLTALGYPPKEDRLTSATATPLCKCVTN